MLDCMITDKLNHSSLDIIKDKLIGSDPNMKPKMNIIDMKRDYDINLFYEKSWWCCEEAITFIKESL